MSSGLIAAALIAVFVSRMGAALAKPFLAPSSLMVQLAETDTLGSSPSWTYVM
jgi:hypothetical protein